MRPRRPRSAFRPLWMFPDSAAAEELARRTFLGPESVFQKKAQDTKGLSYEIQNMVDSPVLRVASFRELLFQLLGNKRVVGSTTRTETGYSYKTDAGAGGTYSWQGMPTSVRVGASAPLRICDQLAVEIARLKGAPKFNAVASDADKDKQIGEIVAFLKLSANHIDAVLTWNGTRWLQDD